jgi:hypothetical protein
MAQRSHMMCPMCGMRLWVQEPKRHAEITRCGEPKCGRRMWSGVQERHGPVVCGVFPEDERENQNTVELAAWRNRLTAARCPTPLGEPAVTDSAHAGSTVPHDARLGGVGHSATVSGHASPTSGGAGQSRPPAFSGGAEHG